MKSNIFVPKKINVGFQNRDDTYTGKLAYVVYYDEKGKLRKKNHGTDGEIKTSQMKNLKMFQHQVLC